MTIMTPSAKGKAKLRGARYSDCDDVVRLEHVIFPGYGEKFDNRFFRTIKSAIDNILVVATEDGRIQGYLAVAELSESAVSHILSENLTSIKELPSEFLTSNE